MDDIELVFSGKLIINKPLPVRGSAFNGSLALALFSGGSVKSVSEIPYLILYFLLLKVFLFILAICSTYHSVLKSNSSTYPRQIPVWQA